MEEPLNSKKFVMYKQLTDEQLNAALVFMDALYSEDIADFWDSIADIDKSRLKGVYLAQQRFHEDSDFESFLEYMRGQVRKNYEKVKENYGTSTTARYTQYGEVYVYVLDNVDEMRVYTEETLEHVFPVILSPNVRLSDEKYKIEYKVSIYDDDYRDLNF